MASDAAESPANPGEVSLLLARFSRGDTSAEGRLMPLVYNELRRLAASYMRHERPSHTLQATALVNEAYMRLVRPQKVDYKDRAHFFGIASRLMRQILVEHARGHQAGKRGGHTPKIQLDDGLVFAPEKSAQVLALDEALEDLARLDSRQCQIVELRFFTGLSVEETAEVLSVSASTVKQEWAVAKVWLHRRISRNRFNAI
jgi:RNA polymerase sigma factor (TIGR02999 family)